MMRHRHDTPLGRILLAHGWVTPEALARAQSRQWGVDVIDPVASPPDPRLIDAVGAAHCLTHNILPWRRMGNITWVATCDPERFGDLIRMLPAEFGTIRMLICSEKQIHAAILAIRRTELIRMAEVCVPATESCRTRKHRMLGGVYLLAASMVILGFCLLPVAMLRTLVAIAAIGLIAQAGLKLVCFVTALWTSWKDRRCRKTLIDEEAGAMEMAVPLPVISVLVPLFQESDVAEQLVARLLRLRYPRELTDIVMVVETGDEVTKDALAVADLPHWIRVIEVPDGPIRTKPRALNYALGFCRGEVIGIWDAEDQPDPDQLHRIARHFSFAPPELGCLQGVLDYYNPQTNRLARCFTIEYAVWFRVLLPAFARLGFAIPLGGTTCFFRREALEDVGAWDAWNVTEDADLGIRLARHGWRTEVVATTTEEEANCRPLAWIRQRSRWLKGYAMTWEVNMRSPRRLWRDLGPWRFCAFQVQFLFMLTQYLLAPVIWGFWLLSMGISYPLREALQNTFGAVTLSVLLGILIGSGVLDVAVGIFAVRRRKHRHLLPWVPMMQLYFPLGYVAAWKAFYEMLKCPFYWDKTAHGIFAATTPQNVPMTPPDTVLLPVMGQIGKSEQAEAVGVITGRNGEAANSAIHLPRAG
ncbi:glycosyltransferase [Paracoccus alkanivorans]|uniref:Glycosyltransferase n=2 Tax=Paracoccus alkanivorans TaxID=2116655 RepID=A0A3M0M7N6_9RHOB|nr:glycosyltransferase [Paracoccus alkanivorans]